MLLAPSGRKEEIKKGTQDYDNEQRGCLIFSGVPKDEREGGGCDTTEDVTYFEVHVTAPVQ